MALPNNPYYNFKTTEKYLRDLCKIGSKGRYRLIKMLKKAAGISLEQAKLAFDDCCGYDRYYAGNLHLKTDKVLELFKPWIVPSYENEKVSDIVVPPMPITKDQINITTVLEETLRDIPSDDIITAIRYYRSVSGLGLFVAKTDIESCATFNHSIKRYELDYDKLVTLFKPWITPKKEQIKEEIKEEIMRDIVVSNPLIDALTCAINNYAILGFKTPKDACMKMLENF